MDAAADAGPGERRGILVTRPEPGLSETMRAVSGLGFEPVACPLLRIRACRQNLPRAEALDAVLLTSGQAIAPLVQAAVADPALTQRPLLAVGDATAGRARAAGFADVASAAGNAADLLALLRARLPPGRTVLLATASRQGTSLASELRRAGYKLHRRAVYAADPVRRLPEPATTSIRSGAIAAALFFSAEAARNFGQLCPVSMRPSLGLVRAVAISPAVGAALTALPWQSVDIAAHPDSAAMLSLLRHLPPEQPVRQ